MSDRGEYRAIYTVLWNGPDWQQLPPEARLVWLALKGNCGPTGLACLPAVHHQVSRWTGLDVAAVTRACAVLQTQGWMLSEGDVVWVRGGIRNDPLRQSGNANHRKSALAYVASLPRLAIVAEFVREHPDWFPVDEAQPVVDWVFTRVFHKPPTVLPERVPDGMGDTIGDTIPHTTPITETETENGERILPSPADAPASAPARVAPKTNRPPASAPKYPHYPDADCAALYEAWRAKVGAVAYPEFRKATAPLFTAAGPYAPVDELVRCIGDTAALESSRGRVAFLTPRSWVGGIAEHIRVTRLDADAKMRLLDEAERRGGRR